VRNKVLSEFFETLAVFVARCVGIFPLDQFDSLVRKTERFSSGLRPFERSGEIRHTKARAHSKMLGKRMSRRKPCIENFLIGEGVVANERNRRRIEE